MKPEDALEKALHELGLSQDEARVYHALVTGGARPASVIAGCTGLKRGHTYNLLESLINRSLVQEFLKGGVRQFLASSPQSLLTVVSKEEDQLAKKRAHIAKLLPELARLWDRHTVQPKVRLFRGVDGIKEIYEDMLRCSDMTISAIIDVKYSNGFVGEKNSRWLDGYIRRRAARNISWHGIVVRSQESDWAVATRPAEKRRIKMLEGIELPAMVEVYENKVSIICTWGEHVGFVIENENFSEFARNIHQAVWTILPDYPVLTGDREEQAEKDYAFAMANR